MREKYNIINSDEIKNKTRQKFHAMCFARMENVVIKTSARLRNQYDPEEGFPEIQYAKLNSFRLNEIRIYFQLGLTVTSKLTNLSDIRPS